MTWRTTPGAVTGHCKDPSSGVRAADLRGQPISRPAVRERLAATDQVTVCPVSRPPVTDRPVTPAPVSDREFRRAGDRRSDPDTEELLAIVRSAVRAEDKLTRQVIAQAVRGQKIPLSSDTLTAPMAQLREQHDTPSPSHPPPGLTAHHDGG
ncbi:hypothetical protein [Streptomyces sp. CBMA29]|uniref:hypothetical protein n=1 Tax=Streptomyces sp. CBMA29 TaxID=1896314 RepID=UPI001CB6E325|nr:hypothetical protein [Streptomyces sp. CBMA29]MBD0737652.1 hypothetical protein [Streptomyces sp. CBMA29]